MSETGAGSSARKLAGAIVAMLGGWVIGKCAGSGDLIVQGGIIDAWAPAWDVQIVLLALVVPVALAAPRFGFCEGWVYVGALLAGGLLGIIGTSN